MNKKTDACTVLLMNTDAWPAREPYPAPETPGQPAAGNQGAENKEPLPVRNGAGPVRETCLEHMRRTLQKAGAAVVREIPLSGILEEELSGIDSRISQ